MSEANFTKGEWGADDMGIVDCLDKIVCDTYMIDDEDLANAHLIAAAPEMYETLETIVDCSSVKTIDLGGGMTIDIESIKQLLARARGES